MYDAGGPLPTATAVVNRTAAPEPVLTADQLARINAAVRSAVEGIAEWFRRFRVAMIRAWQQMRVLLRRLGITPGPPPRGVIVARRARRAELRRRYRKPRPTGWSVRAMRRRGELPGSC